MFNVYLNNRYQNVTASLRRNITHTASFGDDLLWWIPEVMARLVALGYAIRLPDEQTNAEVSDNDILIQVDAPIDCDPVAKGLFVRIPPKRRILLRLEPPNILPSQYQAKTLSKYGALLHVEPADCDRQIDIVRHFKVPAPLPEPNTEHEPENRAGIIAITSNKRILGRRGKLYRDRIRAYKLMAGRFHNFDLYGQSWEYWQVGIPIVDRILRRAGPLGCKSAERSMHYKGRVPDKRVIRNYGHSLVIENYLGHSYVSEKLFDSLKYGVKVIYIGSEAVEGLRLGDLIIRLDSPRAVASLPSNLGDAEPLTVVKNRYSAWLRSEAGVAFSVGAAANTIAETIVDVTRSSQTYER